MHTVLIAHHDVSFAEHLAAELRSSGYYTIVTCPGPWPPQRCIRCDKGYCPLSEGADLMIYDPQLTSLDANGTAHNLAVDSALAHPGVPMLLAWSPGSVPDAGTLRFIRTEAPWVHVAAREQSGLLGQVRELLVEAPRYTLPVLSDAAG
jgi:hypothetical protein